MNERKEGIIFYESQLSKEIVEKCKTETKNEIGYVTMLIERYKDTSNYNHNKLNKINEEEK
ncbi:hypothetical protein ES703_24352 [subsurface metagenome]